MVRSEIEVGDRVVHFFRQGSYVGVNVGMVVEVRAETSEIRIWKEQSSEREFDEMSKWIKTYNCVKV